MPLHPKALLASSLGEQEQYEQSQQLGSQALIEQDEWVRAQAAIATNVVSYSLYGTDPLYGEGAVLNTQTISELLPAWQVRIYHDDSISPQLISRLQQVGAQTLRVADLGISHWPGTFWRFHAVSDPHVERVLFRDADSQFSVREMSLVEAWLQSPYPFHVIRDWYTHVELILAGLWGAHAPYLSQMPNWIEHYVMHELEHSKSDDQLFLAKMIWPRIYRHTLVHDSLHQALGAQPIVMPRILFDHSAAIGGYGAVSFPVTISPSSANQKYFIEISDVASRSCICRYERIARDGLDKFRIPNDYNEKIKAGVWKIEVGMAA